VSSALATDAFANSIPTQTARSSDLLVSHRLLMSVRHPCLWL